MFDRFGRVPSILMVGWRFPCVCQDIVRRLGENAMQASPWEFGWTQLLTIVGFVITIGIAIGGFRTFRRWKRERVEERRIDIAFDALSLAKESKFIFGKIRDPNGFEGEWKTMPIREGESQIDRSMRGGTYAILMRLNKHADYFERVSRLQPKAIAAFGARAEAAFERLSKAHSLVHGAAFQLTWWLPVHPEKPTQDDFEMRMQLRGDLWAGFRTPDRVEVELSAFRSEMEAIFQPVIEGEVESNPKFDERPVNKFPAFSPAMRCMFLRRSAASCNCDSSENAKRL